VGLEPTTPGLAVLDVLLYDHQKEIFSQEQKARTHRVGPFTLLAGVVPPYDGSHPSYHPITLPVC
jgi:hypothetical protein